MNNRRYPLMCHGNIILMFLGHNIFFHKPENTKKHGTLLKNQNVDQMPPILKTNVYSNYSSIGNLDDRP